MPNDDWRDNPIEQPEELEDLEELVELDSPSEASPSKILIQYDFPSIPYNIPDFWKQNRSPFQAMFTFDHDLNITWVNQALVDIFSAEELQDVVTLSHLLKLPQGDDTFQKLLLSIRKKEKNFYSHTPLDIIIPHRGMCYFTLIILPLLDKNEIPEAYLGILDDQTDVKKRLVFRTFQSLLEASMLKDNDTGNHVKRVNAYSHFMAEQIRQEGRYSMVNSAYVEDISYLAAMHDVGKIGTPDDILNKKGPLEDWERNIMKEHTTNGAFIMNNYPNPMGKDIALNHHERWNGSGYPYGKEHETIPLSARIVAIADVYDALRSKRSYKPEWTHQNSCDLILDGRGTHFDPDLTDLFMHNHLRFDKIWNQLQD